MSLSKDKLKSDLKAVFEATRNNSTNDADSFESFLDAFVNAIDNYVKSGEGQFVAGSLQAGPYAVTPNKPNITKTI